MGAGGLGPKNIASLVPYFFFFTEFLPTDRHLQGPPYTPPPPRLKTEVEDAPHFCRLLKNTKMSGGLESGEGACV